jgi:hypothetical protein
MSVIPPIRFCANASTSRFRNTWLTMPSLRWAVRNTKLFCVDCSARHRCQCRHVSLLCSRVPFAVSSSLFCCPGCLQEVVCVIRLFGVLYKWLSRPFLLKILPQFTEAVVGFFTALDDDQLRTLTKDNVVEVLRHLRALLRRTHTAAATGEIVEVRCSC